MVVWQEVQRDYSCHLRGLQNRQALQMKVVSVERDRRQDWPASFDRPLRSQQEGNSTMPTSVHPAQHQSAVMGGVSRRRQYPPDRALSLRLQKSVCYAILVCDLADTRAFKARTAARLGVCCSLT